MIEFLKGLLSSLAISIAIFSCEDDSQPLSETGLMKLEYGTSFGFCIGYCRRDLTVSPTQITFTKSGRPDSVQTIRCEGEFDYDQWNSLSDQISIPESLQLDSIIGCPDCADGGAEYIALEGSDFQHKVTFEFNKEPDEVANYIEELRSFLVEYEDCGG